MTVVRSADARRTTTPNATMTTFASPTQGGAASAMWRVDMATGAKGPVHSFDVEQIWTVLDGAATIDIADHSHSVATGDTVILPAGVPRQIHADPNLGFAAVVAAPAGARARPIDGDEVVPAWIA
ncbi:cupin domain-containing protein [Frankia sp. Cppng1_Ct_nod]|uniref:cupin domain-containing protein n=1 Tax=Frankia sp. Cppng1_Ct_nod TaxID=2897162 RepID=UPI002024A2A4|nr:cupin domain-containing protein [Frankia sp. Cppng1_Ct_nod]